jgi:hypothetical protein
MEVICPSEMSVNFQQITQCYITEDSTLHNDSCENLKSYLFKILDSRMLRNRSLFGFSLRPNGLHDHVESLCMAVIVMTVP